MEKVFVCDEDFQSYDTLLSEINAAIESRIDDILVQLRKACDEGIKEGVFHNNLQLYIDKLALMKGQLSYFTAKMQEHSINFIGDIASLDVN